MELGKHLGKGLWGLADKALPVLYGLGYVLLVIRVLPAEEFGNWTLLQEIFLLLSGLVTAFALNPLLKYAAEDNIRIRGVVTVSVLMQAGFVLCSTVLLLAFREPLAEVLHSRSLGILLAYVPVMLVASFVRNMAIVLLQARFRLRPLFFVDAVHFLGAPFLTWVWSRMHAFDEAMDLVTINIISLFASSLVGFAYTWRDMALTRRPGRGDVTKVWRYGSYSLGSVLSSLFSGRADSFVLAAWTGPVEVAVYNSVKIFIRAYEMVAQVVQMFILPASSRLLSRNDRGLLKALVEKALLFGTVGMVPVLAGFVVLAGPLVHLVYEGKYVEAIPQLQLFGVLALCVPSMAIASNVLLGIGETRVGFIVGIQSLVASMVLYVVLIPFLGVTGATLGYILSSVVLCVLSMRQMANHIPLRAMDVLRRWRDITSFVSRRLQYLRSR